MGKPDSPTRVRVKIYTDPKSGRQYIVALGEFHRNSDIVFAYAMNDEGTVKLEMNTTGWNNLPYHYVTIDEEAPKPTERTLNIPPPKEN